GSGPWRRSALSPPRTHHEATGLRRARRFVIVIIVLDDRPVPGRARSVDGGHDHRGGGQDAGAGAAQRRGAPDLAVSLDGSAERDLAAVAGGPRESGLVGLAEELGLVLSG